MREREKCFTLISSAKKMREMREKHFYLNIFSQEDCAVGFNPGQLQRVERVSVCKGERKIDRWRE